MNCKYFGKCGSCTLYNMSYFEQFEFKKIFVLNEFKDFNIIIEPFYSKDTHFRNRAEFKIFHDDTKIDYSLNSLQKEHFVIDDCLIVNEAIYDFMPKLIDVVRDSEIISHRLFGVEFLSSSIGELLVAMLYHKKIDENLKHEVLEIEKKFGVKVVLRSRGERFALSRDFIFEQIQIGENIFHYKHVEGSFTQPNAYINKQMLNWVFNNSKDFSGDLLELYCGSGNFTMMFSTIFNKVLATEISKSAIKTALENMELNGISNIEFARMSSEDFTKAYNKERSFFRLKDIDLDSYNFKTVFVDPPRSGLDESSINLVNRFENIIYISCNPLTLKENLLELTKTHEIKKFAMFDQFPYTKHIECGVILTKKV